MSGTPACQYDALVRNVLAPARPGVPRGLLRRALTVAALVTSMMLPMTVPAEAQGRRLEQSQVKAAFLYNLAKFVQWPPAQAESDDLVFCVIGNEFMGASLQHLVKGKSLHERKIAVHRRQRGDDLTACHIVFVSGLEAPHTADLLRRVQAAGVLTVGETPEFVRDGGHARFYVESNYVRIEIDAAGADRAGLKIDSKLLSLARR